MVIVQVIVGGLLLGAIYALFSSGLTLIWGMMNFINFAHGEFVMLGMYVALLVVTWLGGGPRGLRHCGGARLCSCSASAFISRSSATSSRGPMLAQILSTFGLALLLRYTAFWIFSANFVSLPQTSLGGTINFGGIFLPRRAARRRRRRHRAHDRAASAAHAHDDRQQASGRGRGSRRGDADGHQARSHAGAGLGSFGGRRRHRRRA